MSKINDGGPAFPVNDTYHGVGNIERGSEGMTLRDAIALSVQIDREFSAKWGEALVGRPQPPAETPNTPEKIRALYLSQMQWWADVEAAYRYLVADAVLKARGESHD